MAGDAVYVALTEFLAKFTLFVEDLDGPAAHDVEESFLGREMAATSQVTDIDVLGEFIEEFLAQVFERIALFEKLADLDQFDFHRSGVRSVRSFQPTSLTKVPFFRVTQFGQGSESNCKTGRNKKAPPQRDGAKPSTGVLIV